MAGFAAWKTLARHDRAARYLFDVWALAERGHITTDAADLFLADRSAGGPPQRWMFATARTGERWPARSVTQTDLAIPAAEALQDLAQAVNAGPTQPDLRERQPRAYERDGAATRWSPAISACQ